MVLENRLESCLGVDLYFPIVTAIQHFDLSKILLTVYDPRIPRLGPSQRAAARRIEVSNSRSLIKSIMPILTLIDIVRSQHNSETSMWHSSLESSSTSSYEHSLYVYLYVRGPVYRFERAEESD